MGQRAFLGEVARVGPYWVGAVVRAGGMRAAWVVPLDGLLVVPLGVGLTLTAFEAPVVEGLRRGQVPMVRAIDSRA